MKAIKFTYNTSYGTLSCTEIFTKGTRHLLKLAEKHHPNFWFHEYLGKHSEFNVDWNKWKKEELSNDPDFLERVVKIFGSSQGNFSMSDKLREYFEECKECGEAREDCECGCCCHCDEEYKSCSCGF